MTTLEKLKTLQHYSVGKTHFEEKEKKFFAHHYEESAKEYGVDIKQWGETTVYSFPVIYASSMEELIDKAYEAEEKYKKDSF